MIIESFVTIKMNGANKKHFENLGDKFSNTNKKSFDIENLCFTKRTINSIKHTDIIYSNTYENINGATIVASDSIQNI